jgi:hypothetical protein
MIWTRNIHKTMYVVGTWTYIERPQEVITLSKTHRIFYKINHVLLIKQIATKIKESIAYT